jgi:hypothetical protein
MPELSGVKGDSAQGKLGHGRLGDPCHRFRRRDKVRAEYIRGALGAGESERPIVAEKFRSESGWSQGALAKVRRSQRPLELIG